MYPFPRIDVKPFFTIVTISFNQASYLKRAIQSVLLQDFDDYEYIIWDGGSSDGTDRILNDYRKDPRVSIYQQSDKGPSDALNRGFSKARGSYYIYLNSDDELLPGALSQFCQYIEADPLAVHCGSALYVNALSTPIRPVYSEKFYKFLSIFGQCMIVQPSTCIPSSVFHSVGGFNVDNRSNWDHELLLSMHFAGARIVSHPHFISAYRLHSASITSSAKLSKLHSQYRKRIVAQYYGVVFSLPVIFNVSCSLARVVALVMNPSRLLFRFLHGRVYGCFENEV